MGYNNLLRIQDLLQNDKLQHMLPQIPRGVPLRNVYSFAEVERRVMSYLKGVFSASSIGTNDDRVLQVNMPFNKGVQQLKSLKSSIEQFYNNIPRINAGIRRNTPMYTSYKSVDEIRYKDTIKHKAQLMQDIVDNLTYNPQFISKNTAQTRAFLDKQDKWKRRVGYKE